MADHADTQTGTVLTTGAMAATRSDDEGVATPVRKSAGRSAPKWETDARDRLRAAIRRFARPLTDLIARDANEGDTRLLVTDFLCDGLGYDKYEDLTTEYQVKGEFADYGVRIAKQLVAFIEVKRCTTKLNVRHLRQVEMYAVNEGVEWMILTNGQVWQVWHLTAGLPVELSQLIKSGVLRPDCL
jgi:type I restriction and modification enzyme subunit R-like protein